MPMTVWWRGNLTLYVTVSSVQNWPVIESDWCPLMYRLYILCSVLSHRFYNHFIEEYVNFKYWLIKLSKKCEKYLQFPCVKGDTVNQKHITQIYQKKHILWLTFDLLQPVDVIFAKSMTQTKNLLSVFLVSTYLIYTISSISFLHLCFAPPGTCRSRSRQQRAAVCCHVKGRHQTATSSSCSHMLTVSLTGSLLK